MKNVWLDVDPGHDDAIAIMLAVHCPNINLLGVSTTFGNAGSEWTSVNAARCLHAYGADSRIKVYPGVTKPLILPARHDPEIHGVDGLGGVQGLPEPGHPEVQKRFVRVFHDGEAATKGEMVRAMEGMVTAIKQTWKNGKGEKVTVVSTGPMTNIALFVSVYPDLAEHAVEEFVFMGGGVGMGNRSSVAEYNILCDPHAAQIVLDTPVKTVMIPINVTHSAIATKDVQRRLLSPSDLQSSSELPPAETSLRHTLSTLITYFAEAYKATFGFIEGPPLHDALTIAYLSKPELFKGKRYRVDVELNSGHCMGETVVDIWDYRRCSEEDWGKQGKNCLVMQELDVAGFFDLFLECVACCDQVSPLNQSK